MAKSSRDSALDGTQKHSKAPGRPVGGAVGGQPGQPVFAEPKPSPDPTGFKNPVTDQKLKEILKLEPAPQPRGSAVEPILTLAQVYGSAGAAKVAAIQQARQIVFHSVGDTGDRKSTRLNSSHQIISYAVFCLKKKKRSYHRYDDYLQPPPISTRIDLTEYEQ